MELAAEDIKITLGSHEILKGIQMEAKNREFIGVIGPNGSGKSTLLKCLYRVLKPDEGAVYLGREPLAAYRVRESAQRIAVVQQHNYYNFEFLVREIVLMGRAPHKKAMERDTREDYRIADEALKAVGMEDYAKRIFSTLSGGEQQRIILARALAQQTPCLILDEPTNHLDIKYQLQMLETVRKLGITVVAAFHDLNLAARYCDRIYALRDGKIVAGGSPEEVLTPELIRRLYEVEATITRDGDKSMNIVFRSCSKEKKSAN